MHTITHARIYMYIAVGMVLVVLFQTIVSSQHYPNFLETAIPIFLQLLREGVVCVCVCVCMCVCERERESVCVCVCV